MVDNLLIMTTSSPSAQQGVMNSNSTASKGSFQTFLTNSTNSSTNVIDNPKSSLSVLRDQLKATLKMMQRYGLIDDQLIIDKLSFEELTAFLEELLTLLQTNELFMEEKDVAFIESLLEQLKDVSGQASNVINEFTPFLQIDLTQTKDVTNEHEEQTMQLLDAIKRALQMSQSEESVRQASENVLRFLKQWSQLTTRLDTPQLNALMSEQLTEEEEAIWRHLVQTYTNRFALNKQNMYTTDSNITRSDVAQWLQQAYDRYITTQMIDGHISPNSQGAMSQIEQYVIHVQDSDRVERISNEFMQKFEQVIRSSRFVQGPQTQQLSIMLKPEHLGNMTVRFAQNDGEMTVKIIVSTQLAKEMLESNIHQLKHMFAPHQVSIERDETVNDKEFFGELHEEEEQEEQHHDETFEEQFEEEFQEEIDFQSLINELQKEE